MTTKITLSVSRFLPCPSTYCNNSCNRSAIQSLLCTGSIAPKNEEEIEKLYDQTCLKNTTKTQWFTQSKKLVPTPLFLDGGEVRPGGVGLTGIIETKSLTARMLLSDWSKDEG